MIPLSGSEKEEAKDMDKKEVELGVPSPDTGKKQITPEQKESVISELHLQYKKVTLLPMRCMVKILLDSYARSGRQTTKNWS